MLSDCLTADYKHVKVIHFILKQIPALRIAGEIPQQARKQSPGVRNCKDSQTRDVGKLNTIYIRMPREQQSKKNHQLL